VEEIKVVDERLQRVACCVLNDNEVFMKLKRLIEVLCSDDFEILCSDDFSRLLAKRLKSLLRGSKSLLRGSAKRLKSLLRGSSALVTMLASEEALRRDWDSPEEDAAWAHL